MASWELNPRQSNKPMGKHQYQITEINKEITDIFIHSLCFVHLFFYVWKCLIMAKHLLLFVITLVLILLFSVFSLVIGFSFPPAWICLALISEGFPTHFDLTLFSGCWIVCSCISLIWIYSSFFILWRVVYGQIR